MRTPGSLAVRVTHVRMAGTGTSSAACGTSSQHPSHGPQRSAVCRRRGALRAGGRQCDQARDGHRTPFAAVLSGEQSTCRRSRMIHLSRRRTRSRRSCAPREIDRLEIHEVAFEAGVCPHVSHLEGGKQAFVQVPLHAAEGVHGWRPPLRTEVIGEDRVVHVVHEIARLRELVERGAGAQSDIRRDASWHPGQPAHGVPAGEQRVAELAGQVHGLEAGRLLDRLEVVVHQVPVLRADGRPAALDPELHVDAGGDGEAHVALERAAPEVTLLDRQRLVEEIEQVAARSRQHPRASHAYRSDGRFEQEVGRGLSRRLGVLPERRRGLQDRPEQEEPCDHGGATGGRAHDFSRHGKESLLLVAPAGPTVHSDICGAGLQACLHRAQQG